MTKGLTKQKKASEGEETPPRFRLGGCCDYSVGWRLNGCRQTPPFCGPHWLDWLTDWPIRGETQKSVEDKFSFVRVAGRFVWNWTAALLPVATLPPLLPPPPPPPHMLAGHMLLQLVNMTVDEALIDSWSAASSSIRLCWALTTDSLAYLMRAAVTTMSLCQLQANLTALSCTSSIPTQQHSQIELASDSEWSERLRNKKKRQKQ